MIGVIRPGAEGVGIEAGLPPRGSEGTGATRCNVPSIGGTRAWLGLVEWRLGRRGRGPWHTLHHGSCRPLGVLRVPGLVSVDLGVLGTQGVTWSNKGDWPTLGTRCMVGLRSMPIGCHPHL